MSISRPLPRRVVVASALLASLSASPVALADTLPPNDCTSLSVGQMCGTAGANFDGVGICAAFANGGGADASNVGLSCLATGDDAGFDAGNTTACAAIGGLCVPLSLDGGALPENCKSGPCGLGAACCTSSTFVDAGERGDATISGDAAANGASNTAASAASANSSGCTTTRASASNESALGIALGALGISLVARRRRRQGR